MEKRFIAIKVGDHLIEKWVANMSNLMPEFQVISWYDVKDKESVDYVIGWCPDAKWINSLPNVKAVVSVGSGVDHIINLKELRENITVIRTVSDDLTQRVMEFVTLCVLSWHRQLPQIIQHNATREWHRFTMETSECINVGVMGYGSMGQAVVNSLKHLGYNVSVWASTVREIDNTPYFHGDDMLADFATDLDVIICLLPLTDKTENILNKDLMRKLKKGGCVMNFARGGHLVDKDLFELLENGHLSAAYLDGFREEPLPSSSYFFDNDKIIVTFHSAGYISPEIGPKIIANNIRKFDKGEEVYPLYDKNRGF